MRIADLLEDINAQSSVRVSERDVRLALNELVSTGLTWQRAGCPGNSGPEMRSPPQEG